MGSVLSRPLPSPDFLVLMVMVGLRHYRRLIAEVYMVIGAFLALPICFCVPVGLTGLLVFGLGVTLHPGVPDEHTLEQIEVASEYPPAGAHN